MGASLRDKTALVTGAASGIGRVMPVMPAPSQPARPWDVNGGSAMP